MNALSPTLRSGIAATLAVVAFALLVATSVTPAWLGGWGSLFLNALVPSQIVISLLWGCQHPARLAALAQPWRGLAFTALTLACGAVVGGVAWWTVGAGAPEPTPMVIMYLIWCVPVALWLVVVLQAWPLARWIRSPLALGVATVLTTHLLGWGLFRGLFDFGFLRDAPFYQAAQDPGGSFMAWLPLTVSLISLVVILMLVLLDFWPVLALLRRLRPGAAPAQPLFGAVSAAFIAAAVAGVWQLAIVWGGLDVVVFMTRWCVPAIFGIFILLVMLEGVPTLQRPQPGRGLLLCAWAAVLAAAMSALYQQVGQLRFGLAGGAPPYALELWLAPSMLAITFPAMVTLGAYFQFWPLRRSAPKP